MDRSISVPAASRVKRGISQKILCTMCTEKADEAVILDGMVETEKDVEVIRRFLREYEKKYKWDMSGMADDLLKLKEPVFRLRPRVGFGLAEKTFATSATKWIF